MIIGDAADVNGKFRQIKQVTKAAYPTLGVNRWAACGERLPALA